MARMLDKVSIDDLKNMTIDEIVTFLIDETSVSAFLYTLHNELKNTDKIEIK